MTQYTALPIRPIGEHEYEDFYETIYTALDAAWPYEAEMAINKRIIDFERTLAAFDGDRMVATASSARVEMTVPAGSAPVAAVADIGVRHGWRRRGLMTALMRRQLDDLRERGESVAALYASQAGIYGRYGYGQAGAEQTLTIPTATARLQPRIPRDPSLRVTYSEIANDPEGQAAVREVYAALVAERPGLFPRHDGWWHQVFVDPEHRRGPCAEKFLLLVRDEHGPRGYALFAVGNSWNGELPDNTATVHELFARDAAAHAEIWEELLTRDLVARVEYVRRPADDPVLGILADPRLVRSVRREGLWVRLVDVPGALTARGYAAPVDVTFEVTDDFAPWNAGVWRLTADADGARCVRSGSPAELTLPVDVLGGAYLGGRGAALTSAVAAGLVTEDRPGAVRRLALALAWDPAPWCPHEF
ncbi:GNAT family N-acetyltransferase [Streptomyces sp. NPDC057638]|uniref:GNAT family N-acetyltransferase n=1 Tax=Streptomyces sp. NPDC057638 TaxID=3346190 RepID=UPI0036C90947